MTKNARDYGLAGETVTDWHFRCGNQTIDTKLNDGCEYVWFLVMLWRLNGARITQRRNWMILGLLQICYNSNVQISTVKDDLYLHLSIAST